MLTPKQIEELKELHAKATQGPWRRRGRGSPYIDIVSEARGDDNPLVTLHEAGASGTMAERRAEAEANAELIIAAKTHFTSLLAEIEALRDGWQDIATAPKDGRGLLLIDMGAEEPGAGFGAWIHDCWSCLDPEGGPEDDRELYRAMYWTRPTHWRPLPPPPKGATDEA